VDTYQAAAFDALGDPTRREIFERLSVRPQAVGELAAGLPVSRPAVSQHLRVLKGAGLLTDRASGSRRIYQVDPTGINALRACLDSLWGQALGSYAPPADHAARSGENRD